MNAPKTCQHWPRDFSESSPAVDRSPASAPTRRLPCSTTRWPGNIRELRNVVERAVILCQGDTVGLEHLPDAVAGSGSVETIGLGDDITLDKLEELHIRRVLGKTRSLDEAATVLGIDLATLWRRRKKYGDLSSNETPGEGRHAVVTIFPKKPRLPLIRIDKVRIESECQDAAIAHVGRVNQEHGHLAHARRARRFLILLGRVHHLVAETKALSS